MTRAVFDKRTLRRRFGSAFAAAIATGASTGTFLEEIEIQLGGEPAPDAGDEPVQVFARKRPLFPSEAAAGEFDVVTASPHGLLVHACRTRADLRTPYLATHYSPLYAFSEAVGNDEVVARLGLGELLDAAARGLDSALCCFGQTGSGKSYTMGAVLSEAAHLLFDGGGLLVRLGLRLQLAAYEVCGPAAHDLLGGRAKMRMRDEIAPGNWHHNASARDVGDAAALQQLLAAAARERKTAATARNAGSSRSHAFYELRFLRLSAAGAALRGASGAGESVPAFGPSAGVSAGGGGGGGGSLLLVDLAGSERAADSAAHDWQQQAESAEINSGLSTLKECFRQRNAAARAAPGATPPVVPFRESTLTRLMRRVLEPQAAAPAGTTGGRRERVVVVATVSPCAADTEATLNTLRHAAVMAGVRMERDADMLLEEKPLDPGGAGTAAPAAVPAGRAQVQAQGQAYARPGAAAAAATAATRARRTSSSSRLPSAGALAAMDASRQHAGPPQQLKQQRTAPQRQPSWPSATAAGSVLGVGDAPSSRPSRSPTPPRFRLDLPGRHVCVGGLSQVGCGSEGSSAPSSTPSSCARTPAGGTVRHAVLQSGERPAPGRLQAPARCDDQGSGEAWLPPPPGISKPRDAEALGPGGSPGAASTPLMPAKWSPADVRRWVSEVGGGRYSAAAAALLPSVNGKAFTRFPEARFKQLFGSGDAAARRGRELYELLREEVRSASALRMEQAQAARDTHAQVDGAAPQLAKRQGTPGCRMASCW